MTAATYQGQRLIKLPAVEALFGHKKTWIYTQIKLGNIPAPKRLSSRDVFWDEAEIIAAKDRLFAQAPTATYR